MTTDDVEDVASIVFERDIYATAIAAIHAAIAECALGGPPETAVLTIARVCHNLSNVLALQQEERE